MARSGWEQVECDDSVCADAKGPVDCEGKPYLRQMEGYMRLTMCVLFSVELFS